MMSLGENFHVHCTCIFIHQHMIKQSYAECTLLFQLIKLIDAKRRDPTDIILETIAQNDQSYCQLL